VVSGQIKAAETQDEEGAVSVRTYRDLIVWQKAMVLAQEVYRIARCLPVTERFGLTTQLQRAAVSIPSNIAEGQARQHGTEFRQFLYQALGSLAELDTQLTLAAEFGYLSAGDTDQALALIEELRKMAHTLIHRLPNRRSLNRALTTHHSPLTTGH
jgi:four helix bundle protein